MQITLYSFNKRINSTKIVNVDGVDVPFTYKEETDLYNPVIELAYDIKTSNFNYARIGNYYYFINSVETVRMNLWRAYLKIDLLATFKQSILNTDARVLYSANNYSLDMIDDRIVSTGKNLISTEFKSMLGFDTTGQFFITTLNTEGGGQFTTTYAVSEHGLSEIVEQLNSDEVIDKLKKWWNNPFESIVEVYFLPTQSGWFWFSESTTVKLGNHDTGVVGFIVKFNTNILRTKSATFSIPWHYSDFRNLEPYTSINFYLPGVGLVTISPSDVYNTNELYIEYMVDPFSGNVLYEIINKHENVIATFSGNLKVSMPVGGDTPRVQSVLNFVSGAIATTALAVSGHPAAAVTSGAYAVSNAINQRQYIMNGAFNGSILSTQFFSNGYMYMWVVSKETYVTPDNIRPLIGNPCGRVLRLSECAGYVRTAEASVTISGYYEATSQINALLNGGVYIE